MPSPVDRDALRDVGLTSGLDLVGFASAEPFVAAREAIEDRRRRGLHAGMQFTFRRPERSTDPGAGLPGARSLVVAARCYPVAEPARPLRPSGRVARYATADHYERLRVGLRAVADVLSSAGWRTRVLADDNGLVDRAAAHRAGLGWYGKSANLLAPGVGSWFVLGSVLTDADLGPSPEPVADGCGTCTRCLDRCPTGAIVAPGVVDARRCLAWLVQAPGDIPVELRVAMGDRLYGCDDCQEACPPNRPSLRAGASTESPPGTWLDLVELLEATDGELLERCGRWYIPERDPRYLRRNALVALGNVGTGDDPEVARVLRRYLDGDDAMLRRHAQWAAGRLGGVGPRS